MNIKTTPSQLMFCYAEETNLYGVGDLCQREFGNTAQAFAASGLEGDGPACVISPEVAENEDKRLVTIGFPIKVAGEVAAPYFIWEAPALQVAWKDYRGPAESIMEGWSNFAEEVENSEYEYAGGWREIYTDWSDFSNVHSEMQFGVK